MILADQPVEAAPQSPHAVVEVRVQVAVPDDVAHGVLTAAGAVQGVDGHAGLRADGNRVQQLGAVVFTRLPRRRLRDVLGHGAPLVHVQVKDVRLLDAGVDQPHPAGISLVRAQDRRDGLSEQPGAVVLLFSGDPFEESLLPGVGVQGQVVVVFEERIRGVLGDPELFAEQVVEGDLHGGVIDAPVAEVKVLRLFRALLLLGLPPPLPQPVGQAVVHRLSAVGQGHGGMRQRMRNGAVGLGFVVEEDGELAEAAVLLVPGMEVDEFHGVLFSGLRVIQPVLINGDHVDVQPVRVTGVVEPAPRLGVVPLRALGLHDEGSEQPVVVGAAVRAPDVAQVVDRPDALACGLPGVVPSLLIAHHAGPVLAHVGSVRVQAP